MASDRYLHHVTLNSAHVRRSPRSEVAGATIRSLTPTLERALEGERTSIWVPGYQIDGARHGRCCMVTLWGHVGEGPRPEPAPLMSVGVAGHSRCGSRLWRELHALAGEIGQDVRADPEETPPAPWVGDLLHPAYTVHPEISEWTGDFSRCVGWTWLELREGQDE